jgi:hypothetical protein
MYYCREGDSVTAGVSLGQGILGTYGNIMLPPSVAATVNPIGGGTTGGALQPGTYYLRYTGVNAGGETTPSPESTALTVAAGNVPQVTLPPLPIGVLTRNIYLTSAGGMAGSETLYANGIASTTFNLSAAQSAGAPMPIINTCLGQAGVGGGFIEIDPVHMPGSYEISFPDACFASGQSVLVCLQGAVNMAPVLAEIALEAIDRQNATSLGISNLDVAISTRSTFAGGAVASVTAPVGLATPDSPVAQAGAAQGGGTQSITLSATASTVDSTYNGSRVRITSGTGFGQTRIITAYLGSTKMAAVSRPWITNPDATSAYAVIADDAVAPNASLQSNAILAASGLDAITIEPGINARQALVPILAACAGAVSGAATTNIAIGGANNAGTNRISATVDGSGNRSAVVLNLPS